MKTRYLTYSFVSAVVAASCAPGGSPSTAAVSLPTAPAFISGTLAMPEISGATMVGDRLLVVADDPDPSAPTHMVALIANGREKLEKGNAIAIAESEQIYPALEQTAEVTDLEDVAVGADGNVYMTTSHSRKSDGLEPAGKKRRHLLKVRFNLDTGAIESAEDVKADLVKSLPEPIKDSPGSGPAANPPGFNIEGLARDGNDLYLGLRAPTVDGKAIVLRLKTAGTPTAKVELAHHLDLGDRGIRAMCAAPGSGGYWLVCGVSRDAAKGARELPNPWSIWFWDGKDALDERFTQTDLPSGTKMPNPETIGLLLGSGGTPGRLLLISDDGGNSPTSSYVLMPIPPKKG